VSLSAPAIPTAVPGNCIGAREGLPDMDGRFLTTDFSVIPAAAPEQREGQAGILGSSPVNSLTVTGRSSSFRACREISPRNARRQRDVSTSLDMMNTGADGRAHVHIAFMNNPSRNATSSQQLCRAIVSNSHVGRRRDHLPSTASPHSPAPLPARFLPASN